MFNDIHPTETGGDGRNLYKFSTPKPGDPKDDKIRCAQCGFPVRLEIEVHGDSTDSPGISQVDTSEPIANNQDKIPVHLKGLEAFAATSRTVPVATVNSGCRLCGTYNPTGKQSKEFDVLTKDLSGL